MHINNNHLDLQDSILIKDAAIILLENSIITLYTDQHGKIYDQKSSWGTNYTDPVIVGNGNPFIAVIIIDLLLSNGASRIDFIFNDGNVYSRGITRKKGYLIGNTGIGKIDKIIIIDKDGKELYKKRG